MKGNFSMKKAFTLAEVLITLAVIGIVAAVSIPVVTAKYKERATVVALKKFYSSISNAYALAVAENGTPDEWGFEAENTLPLVEKIAPFLAINKICTTGDICREDEDKIAYVSDENIKQSGLFNPSFGGRAGAVLNDGMIFGAFNFSAPGCEKALGTGKYLENVCGEYYVDINGTDKPNRFGVDVFVFDITLYGIVPVGMSEHLGRYIFEEDGCLGDGAPGWGCAAWVILNENLDYLKCKDLSWSGKKKCGK